MRQKMTFMSNHCNNLNHVNITLSSSKGILHEYLSGKIVFNSFQNTETAQEKLTPVYVYLR